MFCSARFWFGKQNFDWLVLFCLGRTVKHHFGRSQLRGDAKWILAMICRPGKLKFFWEAIRGLWFVFKFCGIYGQTDPKTTIVTSKVVHLFKYRKLSSLYLLVKQMWIELVFLQLHRKTNGFLLECSRSGKGQRYFKIFFNYCD